MNGLTFESADQDPGMVNKFGAMFSLNNGISSQAMNVKKGDSGFGVNKTPMEYIKEFFPDLLNRRIWTEQNGSSYHFTPYAAQKIAAMCSNIAANSVQMEIFFGNIPSSPGNLTAQREWMKRTSALLDCIMPGSKVTSAPQKNTSQSFAIYSRNCPK